MQIVFVLLLSLTTHSVAIQAVSLLDALRHANASIFAQQIETDPTLSALYLSEAVKTVFAPVDSVGSSRNVSNLSRLRLRTAGEVVQGQFQAAQQISSFQILNSHPGKIVTTNLPTDRLGPGSTVNVVAKGADSDSSSSNTDTTKSVNRRQYLSTNNNNATVVQQIKISTGLGNNVSIIRGDIPYDGGLIHLVDGFFTLPKPLSATASQTNNSQFASRLSRSNLTSLLDNTPSITVFLPSDAAFAATGNNTQTSSQIGSQLLGHVVQDQVLYIPRLADGATYKTKAGTTLAISVRGGRYFINGVMIVQSDLIIENGVAHILNKVLPGPSPPILTGGSSSSTLTPKATILTIISIVNALVVYSFS